MKPLTADQSIQETLHGVLAPAFAGVQTQMTSDARWNRPVVLVRWPGFAGLLPEQRFRLLLQAIPPEVYEEELAGLIFFELTPDESIDDYLKMPRSEDIVAKEVTLIGALDELSFFDELAVELGDTPEQACNRSFTLARQVMQKRKMSPTGMDELCLLLIRHGAYCDCEALGDARESIERQTDESAPRMR